VSPAGGDAPTVTELIEIPRTSVAEASTIRGTITNARTSQPIADANVYIVGTNLASNSNEAGSYALTNVPAGTHELRVERVGFASASRVVALTDGAVLETSFALTTDLPIERPAAAPTPRSTPRITGRVTSSESGAPLVDVQVYLVGANLGAITRRTGDFVLLNVPPGAYTLRAERIGLQTASRDIVVTEGQVLEIDFQLAGSVAASDSALAAVRDYVNPETGTRIRLRGENSVNQQPPPIIIIDGVRITPQPGEDALSQIKPEDIDRIEVIKGAAAARLYGPDAQNGVIQIFRKKPSGGGAVSTSPQRLINPADPELMRSVEYLRSLGLDVPGLTR
jgi:hypothetical protein